MYRHKGVKMTRINVVPVEELSDQHLIAEYRELPRILKQNINISGAPLMYCLGKNHMKWASFHGKYCANRYQDLIIEMLYRGFHPRFTADGLLCRPSAIDYEPCQIDIAINRQRIKEKVNAKPNFYRWTKRQKPDWL